MFIKCLLLFTLIIASTVVSAAQGTFKPRDSDEEQAWRIYNQYKESRRIEAPLEAQIKQKFNDALLAAYGVLAGKAVDPSDSAEVRTLRETMEAERKRQADLLAAWDRKFYWRYGDLRWMNDKIRDAKTGRDVDRIEFALTYFPFNYVPARSPKPAVTPTAVVSPPSGDATSLTLELPGYWGHLSYTITGARLDPPSGGDRGNVAGRQYTGELTGSTFTVSGNAVSDNPSSGPGSMDYYEIVVSVTVGKEIKEYGYIAPKGEKLSKAFSLSVPVAPGASGTFKIRLMEQNANYGPHGWVVGGNLKPRTAGGTAPAAAVTNVPAGEPKTLFSTANDYGVSNGGSPANFGLSSPMLVTQIMTYHWNGGRGAPGGTLALRNSAGKVFGPWNVTVRAKVYWEVNQSINLPAGSYTVIDSDPATWAQNAQSRGKGMVVIKGIER